MKTSSEICRAIDALDKDREYNYVNPQNNSKIKIVKITPDNSIVIKRRRPNSDWSKEVKISAPMLDRLGKALETQKPINVDRALGASYNTRSVAEALLAHTPEVFTCTPGRVEEANGKKRVKNGHKHIIWQPSSPHEAGRIEHVELGPDAAIEENK